tara:strand:+ start:1851 stop:2072 length:222 start_codon:yes stop_codon:yes gene_type:complete
MSDEASINLSGYDFRYMLEPLCADPRGGRSLLPDKFNFTLVLIDVPMGSFVESMIVDNLGLKYDATLGVIGRI